MAQGALLAGTALDLGQERLATCGSSNFGGHSAACGTEFTASPPVTVGGGWTEGNRTCGRWTSSSTSWKCTCQCNRTTRTSTWRSAFKQTWSCTARAIAKASWPSSQIATARPNSKSATGKASCQWWHQHRQQHWQHQRSCPYQQQHGCDTGRRNAAAKSGTAANTGNTVGNTNTANPGSTKANPGSTKANTGSTNTANTGSTNNCHSSQHRRSCQH